MSNENTDAEVRRLLALPDDDQIDEIVLRIQALPADRKQLVLAVIEADQQCTDRAAAPQTGHASAGRIYTNAADARSA